MKSQLNARWSEVDLAAVVAAVAVVVVAVPAAVVAAVFVAAVFVAAVVDVVVAAVVAVVFAVVVSVPVAVTATNQCRHKYQSAAVVVHLLKILVKAHSVHSKLLWPQTAQLGIHFHRIIRNVSPL